MLDQPIRAQPPKNWLVESILVTILCCLPFGIVGIVNASKVESKFFAGDIDGAERAAADAKKWTVIGFWVGIGCITLYLIFMAGILFFAAKNGGSLDDYR